MIGSWYHNWGGTKPDSWKELALLSQNEHWAHTFSGEFVVSASKQVGKIIFWELTASISSNMIWDLF